MNCGSRPRPSEKAGKGRKGPAMTGGRPPVAPTGRRQGAMTSSGVHHARKSNAADGQNAPADS